MKKVAIFIALIIFTAFLFSCGSGGGGSSVSSEDTNTSLSINANFVDKDGKALSAIPSDVRYIGIQVTPVSFVYDELYYPLEEMVDIQSSFSTSVTFDNLTDGETFSVTIFGMDENYNYLYFGGKTITIQPGSNTINVVAINWIIHLIIMKIYTLTLLFFMIFRMI